MLRNKRAQSILDRLEKSYQNTFNFKKVSELMKEYYKNLGVEIPKIVCIENLQEAYSAAWSAARSAAESAAWSAAWSAAESAAESAARSAAESAAWSAAWSAARSAAESAAWSAARSAAWSAVYLNTLPKNEAVLKFAEIEAPLLEAVENGLGWFFPMQDQLIVVPFPKVILNANKRPHSDISKAIEWPDKKGFYFINGVQFHEELWTKVVSKKMPFQEILAIRDIDQRTQAMRYGSVREFLVFSKAQQLDTYTKYRPDKSEVHYSLHLIPKGDVFTEDAFYMVYDCPSTNHEYMSGVKPFKTVPEAMAWKMSASYPVSAEEWKALQPLVHES